MLPDTSYLVVEATLPVVGKNIQEIARRFCAHMFDERPSSSGAGNGPEGLMDVRSVDLPQDAQYCLCGSLPFMQAVRSALVARGVPARENQYEVFGPGLWPAGSEQQ